MVGRNTTHRTAGCSARNDRRSSSSCMYSYDADLNRENTPVVPTTTSCCTALVRIRRRSCGKNMIPATCTTVSHSLTAICHGPGSSRFPGTTVNFSSVSGNRLGDLLRTKTRSTAPSSSSERRANSPVAEVAPVMKQFIGPPPIPLTCFPSYHSPLHAASMTSYCTRVPTTKTLMVTTHGTSGTNHRSKQLHIHGNRESTSTNDEMH